MNVTVQNPNLPNILPNSDGLYDNGNFSSNVEKETKPISYDFFQASAEEESLSCNLKFSDFDANFEFEVFGMEGNLESNKLELYLNLDNQIKVKAILEGNWKKTEPTHIPSFHIKSFGIRFYENFETPISVFLKTTLWAILGLSSKFKITFPFLDNYWLCASFETSIDEISKFLQERQIAYRLMVIETALGIQLPFPQGFIDGKDVENIAFCYKAIIEREFNWFAVQTTIPCQANEESLSWIPETKEPTSVTFRPEPVVKSIFGVEIPLGIMTGRIDNAVIDNYDEAKEKLKRLGNETVNIEQRSIDGTITMIAVDVPNLSQNPWSEKLQKLIDLDSQLDEKILDKYFALAALTLEGLTEEQKEEITKRPELDEEAFDF